MALLVLGPTPASYAQDIVDFVADDTICFEQDGDTLRLPYISSRSLTEPDPAINRVVIVVTGTLRNVDDYFDGLMATAALTGTTADSTLIIAPQFLTDADVGAHNLPDDFLCWEYYGWRQGDQSLAEPDGSADRPWELSAFAVADTFFLRVADVFPNLKNAVLTGHSAGGQYTNRWMASSTVPDQLRDEHGIHTRGVIANPSTYVYFSPERHVQGTTYDFDIPSTYEVQNCPTYDHYKFGVHMANKYFDEEPDTLRHRYSRRHVVHMVGANDNDPNSWYLDRTCPALMQGLHRLERGQIYYNYLRWYFGTNLNPKQVLAIVPNAGHHHYEMYPSALGLLHVFDYDDDPVTPVSQFEIVTDLASTNASHALSWCDYDNDGWDDLYLAGTGGSNLLLYNKGDGNGFTEMLPAPLNDSENGLATVWGDLDSDGRRDLALINWNGPSQIIRNNDLEDFSALEVPELADDQPTTSADWADYDGDGDLDLLVARTNGKPNLLFRNDNGVLRDASADLNDSPTDTRGVAWADLDADGDPDLVLAENGYCRVLCNTAGTFSDVTCDTLKINASHSAVAVADYDNDGDLDFYVTVRNAANRLLRNDGNFEFTDVTGGYLAGWANTRSASWADYDNDGWLDLYIANVGSADLLLRNMSDGSFADVTASPMGSTGASYGAGWCDYDRDGDLDLYVAVDNGLNRLYANQNLGQMNWLQLDLRQPGTNPYAVGASVFCHTSKTRQLRPVGGDESYMAQGSLTVEFGLNQSTVVDSLVVLWPDRTRRVLTNISPNQRLCIHKDQHATPADLPTTALHVVDVYPNPFNPKADIRFHLPQDQWVQVAVYTLSGRRLVTLVEGYRPAGDHQVTWNGKDNSGRSQASGVYFCRVKAGAQVVVRKMSLIR